MKRSGHSDYVSSGVAKINFNPRQNTDFICVHIQINTYMLFCHCCSLWQPDTPCFVSQAMFRYKKFRSDYNYKYKLLTVSESSSCNFAYTILQILVDIHVTEMGRTSTSYRKRSTNQ